MKKTNMKLLSYSAAAGALLMANNANATIVHTDVDPDSVLVATSGDSFNLDLDGDGQTDLGIKMFSTTYSISYYSSYITSSATYRAYITFAGNSAAGSGSISALSYGANINSTAAFVSTSTISSVLAQHYFKYSWDSTSGGSGDLGLIEALGTGPTTGTTYFTSTNKGNFHSATNKYIGLQFLISGNTHYGWVQVSVSAKGDTVTVLDYAYESVPDYGIQAGVTIATGINDKVEKPTVYSFGRDIHISSRGRGLASVFNLAGQEVASKSFNEGKSSINIKGNSGVYMVRISQNGRTTNHKVNIN